MRGRIRGREGVGEGLTLIVLLECIPNSLCTSLDHLGLLVVAVCAFLPCNRFRGSIVVSNIGE